MISEYFGGVDTRTVKAHNAPLVVTDMGLNAFSAVRAAEDFGDSGLIEQASERIDLQEMRRRPLSFEERSEQAPEAAGDGRAA